MPRQLLSDALEQAERSEPVVRSAALLIKAHEVHEEDSLFGFGSVGFMEQAQDGLPRMPDFLRLANIMDLHMAAPDESSNPELALRPMKSELLRVARGSTPGGVIINSIGSSLTMDELCQELEGGLDRPIVDETHLGATYALNVHSEALSTREFLHVLCDKLGLVVTPGRREISMLVARQG